MKLGMAMTPLIGEAKVIRLRENGADLRRKARARWLAELRRQIACGSRKTFVFLLGATLFVFLFSHERDIQRVTDAKVGRVVAKIEASSKSSPLRQNALNYEREVNEIAK